jgi:hypothetical protein
MRTAALIVALLIAGPAAGGDVAFKVLRTAGEVERLRGGDALPLQELDRLRAGDRIRTAERGRTALQLDTGSILALAGDSELYVHEFGAETGRAAHAWMVLRRGSLRVDSVTVPGLGAQDFRLNAGALKLRIYGAEVIVALEPQADLVCLLRGAVELNAPNGQVRLDVPGECYGHSPDGTAAVMRPASGVLHARIARIEQAPPPQQQREPPPSAAAASPAPGGWTVVVLALADGESAQLEAQGMRERGLDAATYRAQTPGGAVYRIGIGRFGSADEARAFRDARREQPLFRHAWVAEH